MSRHPTLQDVLAARERIKGIAIITPVRLSERLSEVVGCEVWLKLECLQETGSFKVRGAANTLLQLSAVELDAGVVAVSSGNHGRAVAFVAARLGIPATICLSERVPAMKVQAIEALGARVVIAGAGQDEADAAARRLVVDEGLTFIHPFDDPRVISGQGTIGFEIVEQVPTATVVVVPLSGGGLAGGVALAVTGQRPGTQVIGVSQDRGPAMVCSIAAGHLVDVLEEDTLADALAGGLGAANEHSFHLCATLLAGTALVSEEEIGEAMAFLHDSEGLAVEGGGAVGVAALRSGRVPVAGPTVVVISGGNVAPDTLAGVLAP